MKTMHDLTPSTSLQVPKNAPRTGRRAHVLGWLGALAWLGTGCQALPDKPPRAVLYDFGPGVLPAALQTPPLNSAALSLAEIRTSGRLDSTALLYRLGYADAQVLQAYSQARWSQPPAQLLQQRLREVLSADRLVLVTGEAAGLDRTQNGNPDLLRLALDEFSHYFETPERSVGLVRLRATLLRHAPGGLQVRAQHTFAQQQPAPSADAAGGVKALTAASDALAAELRRWLAQAQR